MSQVLTLAHAKSRLTRAKSRLTRYMSRLTRANEYIETGIRPGQSTTQAGLKPGLSKDRTRAGIAGIRPGLSKVQAVNKPGSD